MIAGRERPADCRGIDARLADRRPAPPPARFARRRPRRAVAARAAERLRGDACSVLQVRFARAVWTERRLIQMTTHPERRWPPTRRHHPLPCGAIVRSAVSATNPSRRPGLRDRRRATAFPRRRASGLAVRHAARPEPYRSPPGPARRPRIERHLDAYVTRVRIRTRTPRWSHAGVDARSMPGWRLRRSPAAEAPAQTFRAARPLRSGRSRPAALRSAPSRHASAPAPWRTTGVRSPSPASIAGNFPSARATRTFLPARGARRQPDSATPASQQHVPRALCVPIPRTHQIADAGEQTMRSDVLNPRSQHGDFICKAKLRCGGASVVFSSGATIANVSGMRRRIAGMASNRGKRR